MITFFRPPGFTDGFLDERMARVDIGPEKLREIPESAWLGEQEQEPTATCIINQCPDK